MAASAARTMETSAPEEVAADVARRIGAVDGVSAVVLGGSRAGGDADERSDVDLGICYHPAQPLDVGALRQLARDVADPHPDDPITEPGAWGPWMTTPAALVSQVSRAAALIEAVRALAPRDAASTPGLARRACRPATTLAPDDKETSAT